MCTRARSLAAGNQHPPRVRVLYACAVTGPTPAGAARPRVAQQRAIAGLGGGVEHAGGQAPHGYAFGSRRARPRAVIARSSRARGSSAGGGRSRGAARAGQGQCESVVGQTPHTPRHQNVAARRATAQLSKPARAERARSRLPDALLWSLKFAENLSFRSASVATHTHTSSPLANCPTTDSHCPCPSCSGPSHYCPWRTDSHDTERKRA